MPERGVLDEKLARGFARQVSRRWQVAGRGVRAANFLLAQSLVTMSSRGGKVGNPAFNVALQRHLQAPQDFSATPVFVTARSGTSTRGGVLSHSLVARDILHLRGNGRHFLSAEWTFALDHIWCQHGRVGMEFYTPPLLAEQHLVERWVERTGREQAESLAEAITLALPLALLHLDVARRGREVQALDVAIPAEGGALLGGVELVVAPEVEDGLQYDWLRKVGGAKTGSISFLAPSDEGDLLAVISLRTFLDDGLLTEEQRKHLDRARAWSDAHAVELALLGCPPSGAPSRARSWLTGSRPWSRRRSRCLPPGGGISSDKASTALILLRSEATGVARTQSIIRARR